MKYLLLRCFANCVADVDLDVEWVAIPLSLTNVKQLGKFAVSAVDLAVEYGPLFNIISMDCNQGLANPVEPCCAPDDDEFEEGSEENFVVLTADKFKALRLTPADDADPFLAHLSFSAEQFWVTSLQRDRVMVIEIYSTALPWSVARKIIHDATKEEREFRNEEWHKLNHSLRHAAIALATCWDHLHDAEKRANILKPPTKPEDEIEIETDAISFYAGQCESRHNNQILPTTVTFDDMLEALGITADGN